MPALVAEMPEQRAIRLVKIRPALLANRVVGFGDVDGDQAVRMAGEYRLPRSVGAKLEREPMLRVHLLAQ